MRHQFVADKQPSLLLIIDIQQAMLKVITEWEAVTHRVNQLSEAAGILDIPVLVTEHYKKGLGATIPEVSGGIIREHRFSQRILQCLPGDQFFGDGTATWSSSNSNKRHGNACLRALDRFGSA